MQFYRIDRAFNVSKKIGYHSILPIRCARLRPSTVGGFINYSKQTGPALLLLYNAALAHTLIITDDAEIHEMDAPLPIHQIRRTIMLLKNILYRACCVDVKNKSNTVPSNHMGLSLISSSAKVQRDLYDRSSRRLLCPPKTWLVDDLLEEEIRRCKSHEAYITLLHGPILKLCPFLVSFKRRLKLFEKIIVTDKEGIQGRNDGHSFRYVSQTILIVYKIFIDNVPHLSDF